MHRESFTILARKADASCADVKRWRAFISSMKEEDIIQCAKERYMTSIGSLDVNFYLNEDKLNVSHHSTLNNLKVAIALCRTFCDKLGNERLVFHLKEKEYTFDTYNLICVNLTDTNNTDCI